MKKVIKVILKIILLFLALFLLIVLALQIPYVQNLVKDKVVIYLEEKIKTKVEIGTIEIGLPKKIILRNFYFEDQSKDTLLAGKTLKVDISLFQLLNNKATINSIDLEKITTNIKVNKDTVYNFEYIIKAFETPNSKTDEKGMEISIKKISLNTINFRYNDAVEKNSIDLFIHHFETKISAFNLTDLSFNVPEISLDGLKVDLNQSLVEATKKATENIEVAAATNSLKLQLKNIHLKNIDVNYQDANTNLATKIQFTNLKTKVETVDLEKQRIILNSLELDRTNGQLAFTKSAEKATKSVESSTGFPWEIAINAISITNFNFEFDNDNAAKTQKGIDYNHLKLSDLYFKGKSFAINGNNYSGTINSFGFQEKSGFQLDALTTEFKYTDKEISLKKLYLKTPQTTLQNSVLVTYPSIESILKNPENVTINADLEDNKLGFKDILLLVPQLESNVIFKNNTATIVNFNAKLNGKLNNLKIETFNVAGIGNTKVDVEGTIIGLPDFEKSIFNFNIRNVESSAKDMYAFTPKNTIPNTVELPKKINVKGIFKGSIHVFETNLVLKSTLGNAIIAATYDSSKKNNEKYTVDANLENFNLGKFIKNNQFGYVTANAIVNGRSLDLATATATLTSKIRKATFNNYNYKNINIAGNIKNGLFEANANAKDPNLTFVLDAKGTADSIKPTLDLKLDVGIVNLNKLNFYKDSLKMSGTITADFKDLNLDNLNGNINATNFLVALEKEQFPLENIKVKAISSVENDSITLKSQFANGFITGNYKISTIGNQLMNSISKYYQLDKKYIKNEDNQNLNFEFVITDNVIIKKIIPEIKNLSEITFNGGYNTLNDSIVINAAVPQLDYADNEISNGLLKVRSKENALEYDVSFESIKNTQFEIPTTNLIGKVKENTIDYELNIKDLKNKDTYLIAGKVTDSLGTSMIRFSTDKLILNYDKWKIHDNNLIRLEDKGVLVSNFIIQKEDQLFSVQSENNVANSPIVANFKNFELESLTSIAKTNFEIGGVINGETTINDISTKPLFVADLAIENFKIEKDTIGNINVKVDNKIANLYQANVTLSGLDTQLNIEGNYDVSTESLDFMADIKKLSMNFLQPFSLNTIKESVGFLNGKLNIKGNASSPEINGNIKFNSVGFVVVPLNSTFKLINDEIAFENNKIIFDNFKLKDENDNLLKINGSINSKEYTNPGFDLNVVADNFKAVNSKATDNDLFYGELFLDNNLGIKGTLDSPIIDGNIKINADTKFTFVLPQSDPSIADREGIVEFIDQDQPVLITIEDPTKQLLQTKIKGIDASVNIVVDKKAVISIIIDKVNGDYLKLQGDAELTGGIDPSGKTTLTGKYEFTGGAYEMNFNLIKRKFEIQPESFILWTGEPTTANINIKAVYNVETSPLDLVDDQLVGITAETRNTYKQKIPFETNLIMKGELLQPNITFDIVLPEENNNVSAEIISTTQAKLQQIRRDEDALNKQVFSLLLLNRFIGENPFESEAGGISGTFLAKQSVSKILSEQLNNIANDLIKGFELDFDLEASENYASGEKQERTDLNVGLSKQLLDDRLKVTVGSSFGIEGAQQENEQATNIAGDVTVDYLITKDGRYKLRAYRKNNYQVALQGQVIETGVAFIITMNYDKFRELFQKKRNADRKKGDKNED